MKKYMFVIIILFLFIPILNVNAEYQEINGQLVWCDRDNMDMFYQSGCSDGSSNDGFGTDTAVGAVAAGNNSAFANYVGDEELKNPNSTYNQNIVRNYTARQTRTANEESVRRITGDTQYDCKIFGSVNQSGSGDEPASLAYIIKTIANYIKILGPLLVIVLSGLDFTKAALLGDEDSMKKAQKSLGLRLILVAILFLIPTMTQFILSLINGGLAAPECLIF